MAPFIRIVLRYGVGYFAGSEIGEQLSLDPDMVAALAIGAGFVIEAAYVLSRKLGWKT